MQKFSLEFSLLRLFFQRMHIDGGMVDSPASPRLPVVDFVMASASQSGPILYVEDERSSVSRITLNRPRVLNAINTSLLGGLVQALTRVQVRQSSDVNKFA